MGLALLEALRRSAEHPTSLGPVVARAQESPKHNIARMDLERQQGILDRLVKAEACNHCPEVSTSTHKSGHHSELLPVPSPWLGLHVNLFLLRFKYPYDCKMLPNYDKGS